jgi:hypothetical protein
MVFPLYEEVLDAIGEVMTRANLSPLRKRIEDSTLCTDFESCTSNHIPFGISIFCNCALRDISDSWICIIFLDRIVNTDLLARLNFLRNFCDLTVWPLGLPLKL